MKIIKGLMLSCLVGCINISTPPPPTPAPPPTPKVQIGIGGHPMFSGSPYASISDDSVFSLLQSKGLKRYRFDAFLTDDTVTSTPARMQTLIAAGIKYGIQLEPVLALPFAFGDRTDNGKYPAGDSAAIYSQGYNRAYAFISQYGVSIQDWELGNEINLLAKDSSGNSLFGKGWTATEFDLPVINDWASLLKGISDAVDQVNTEKGLKLRRVVGTTSTMFGFLDFMTSKGIKIDVISYHYYEHLGVDPTNYWGGVQPNFNLFTKLGSYSLPIYVNEINCAEIYDSTYVNVIGSDTMNTCNTNLDQMLKIFSGQTQANIEAIIGYELLDEPSNAVPENRFGFLFDMETPKPMLETLSKYAQ